MGLALAWAAIALARTLGDTVASWDSRARIDPPSIWHPGMEPVERLHRCIAELAALLPRDTVVAFASAPGEAGAEFYRWRWAAYFLPGLEVTWLADRQGALTATHLVTYRCQAEPPPGTHLQLIRQLRGGRLFRILRP
jgi:hypothetical protein